MSKVILGGVLQSFPKHIGCRIYSEEMFSKALDELKHRILMDGRTNKLNKINEKIKNNRKT
jgi:hypothetical protein